MSLPSPASVKTISIIGTGTIGASWATHFLARGYEVQAWDPADGGEARARRQIRDAWPAMVKLGAKPDADPESMRWCSTVAEALEGADFVQESAPEKLDVKRALYEQFDTALPADAVMSTSTSGLLLSELQAGRVGRDHYVLGHPFNPPHLVPLVEVLGGKDTAPEAVDFAMDFYRHAGKYPVRLNREVPGHLANRMQAAIWREAVHAVTSGLASVEDVDAAIAYGPGLRWALMGPHRTFHLAGGDGGIRSFMGHLAGPTSSWWADLKQADLTDEVKQQIIEGVEASVGDRDVAELAAERDALLVELLMLKQQQR